MYFNLLAEGSSTTADDSGSTSVVVHSASAVERSPEPSSSSSQSTRLRFPRFLRRTHSASSTTETTPPYALFLRSKRVRLYNRVGRLAARWLLPLRSWRRQSFYASSGTLCAASQRVAYVSEKKRISRGRCRAGPLPPETPTEIEIRPSAGCCGRSISGTQIDENGLISGTDQMFLSKTLSPE